MFRLSHIYQNGGGLSAAAMIFSGSYKTILGRFEQGALGWAELSCVLRKLKGQLFGGHRASQGLVRQHFAKLPTQNFSVLGKLDGCKNG